MWLKVVMAGLLLKTKYNRFLLALRQMKVYRASLFAPIRRHKIPLRRRTKCRRFQLFFLKKSRGAAFAVPHSSTLIIAYTIFRSYTFPPPHHHHNTVIGKMKIFVWYISTCVPGERSAVLQAAEEEKIHQCVVYRLIRVSQKTKACSIRTLQP